MVLFVFVSVTWSQRQFLVWQVLFQVFVNQRKPTTFSLLVKTNGLVPRAVPEVISVMVSACPGFTGLFLSPSYRFSDSLSQERLISREQEGNPGLFLEC